MLSRHKPLEKNQTNLGRELLTCIGRATAKNDPAPWGQISFNFNYKVNFKVFIPNFGVCSHK